LNLIQIKKGQSGRGELAWGIDTTALKFGYAERRRYIRGQRAQRAALPRMSWTGAMPSRGDIL
jgi:hypothetical protein